MTSRIVVVDASVGIKLVLQETDSARAELLFQVMIDEPDSLFYVPSLFFAECANILWKCVNRGEMTAATACAEERYLRDIPFCVYPLHSLSEGALQLALKHNISAYDGCYCALARQLKAPLVIADEKLARKLADADFSAVLLREWVA